MNDSKELVLSPDAPIKVLTLPEPKRTPYYQAPEEPKLPRNRLDRRADLSRWKRLVKKGHRPLMTPPDQDYAAQKFLRVKLGPELFALPLGDPRIVWQKEGEA